MITISGEDDFEDEKLKPKKSVVTEYYVAVWFQAVASELLGRYPTKLKVQAVSIILDEV